MEAMSTQPLLVILINPTSGPTRTRSLTPAVIQERAEQAGWQVEIETSTGPGDLTERARKAGARGARRIIVMGGDGSINEVVQAIVDPPVELGILPAGTVNILANELGIPADLDEALHVALTGRAIAIDVGVANGRVFTLMVGIGYDAMITRTMWPEIKKIAGEVAYALAGLQSFLVHRTTRMRIRLDGARPVRRLVYLLVVANTRLYAGSSAVLAETASVKDGLFDVCWFSAREWWRVPVGIFRIFSGRGKRFAPFEIVKARDIRIEASRSVPYQLDGDSAGFLPVSIQIRPKALRVVVPAQPPEV
jgi:YegS/Rv2252/BmrU family lipid kinase